MASLVAERLLYGVVEGQNTKVTVRVWTPELVDSADTRCRFTFHSQHGQLPLLDGEAHGVDGVQALIEAFHGIGRALDDSGVEWSAFPDGKVQADGFPRVELSVSYYEPSFRQRMQTYVRDAKLEELKQAGHRGPA